LRNLFGGVGVVAFLFGEVAKELADPVSVVRRAAAS
jgi:hypothetical protein